MQCVILARFISISDLFQCSHLLVGSQSLDFLCMCIYTKKVTVAFQAEAIGSERAWDGAREKCCSESPAPVPTAEHHNPYRAACVFGMLPKCLRLENVEENRGWLYLVVACY